MLSTTVKITKRISELSYSLLFYFNILNQTNSHEDDAIRIAYRIINLSFYICINNYANIITHQCDILTNTLFSYIINNYTITHNAHQEFLISWNNHNIILELLMQKMPQ